MELRKLFYLMLIIPMLFFYTGCSSDDGDSPTAPDTSVNESEVLVQYLESNGDFINTGAPAMITASTVHANLLAGADQTIIDIRSATDYAAGHIDGAVNVSANDVLSYYESNGLQSKEVVVIACYSGQTAAWVTALMNLVGYNNVKDMKWGMTSWNSSCDRWSSKLGNTYSTQMVTSPNAKPAAGELPELQTGATEGADILRARVEAVFTEGFGAATVGAADVFANTSGYFIVNYWPADHYNWKHIPGAMQYTPGQSLKLNADLKTLATDQTVVIYCYTGQTSAHVAAFLRLLGYDAKSLVYGMNSMAYDEMPAGKFNGANEIHDYELVQ